MNISEKLLWAPMGARVFLRCAGHSRLYAFNIPIVQILCAFKISVFAGCRAHALCNLI